ncbi:MAG: hypothetical protein IT572_09740 [Deltaproteobacteria bacterium]|nr:hypothetical protein [Deltaproteobacteria bacterium]
MACLFSRLVTGSFVAALLALPLAAGAATITVTETADSYSGSGCSLRNAIQAVNLGSDFAGCVAVGAYNNADTINLTATQPYVLDIGGPNEDNNQTGDLDIAGSVNIVGLGSGQTTITTSGMTGKGADRVLHVTQISAGDNPITVNLQGLTIRDGDSSESGDGGGILVDIPDVTLNLTDVTVTENESEEDAGGIAFYSSGGQMTLTDSRVASNTAPYSAGGIYNSRSSLTTLVNSTIDGNSSSFEGGGIVNRNLLVVVSSTISRNITRFTLDGDYGRGGGIYNSGGMALINSTISGNTARLDGGGIYSVDSRRDSGERLYDVQALLFNVTIADNTAEVGFGGGVCNDCEIQPQGSQGLEFRVANTLIAQNTADSGRPDCGGQDPFISGGYNLIGDDTDCNGFTATGDQTDVAAGIGALQNNGGPTETHALLTGSLAIDTANDVEGCQTPVLEDLFNNTLTLQPMTEDQRGLTRPVAVLDPAAAICDIGAYELQIEEPTPTPTPVPPPGPQLLEGSGISCSLSLGGSSAGAASLFLFGAVALVAVWRGFGLNRK